MPRGFNTESGGSLTAKQQEVAMRLLDFLKRNRESGYVTPQKPIKSAEIIRLYQEKYGEKISDTLIRACTNYLRADLSYPVVSKKSGYFYAITKSEVQEGLLHMRDRHKALGQAINGLEMSMARMQT